VSNLVIQAAVLYTAELIPLLGLPQRLCKRLALWAVRVGLGEEEATLVLKKTKRLNNGLPTRNFVSAATARDAAAALLLGSCLSHCSDRQCPRVRP
jgi:hypothetical protein